MTAAAHREAALERTRVELEMPADGRLRPNDLSVFLKYYAIVAAGDRLGDIPLLRHAAAGRYPDSSDHSVSPATSRTDSVAPTRDSAERAVARRSVTPGAGQRDARLVHSLSEAVASALPDRDRELAFWLRTSPEIDIPSRLLETALSDREYLRRAGELALEYVVTERVAPELRVSISALKPEQLTGFLRGRLNHALIFTATAGVANELFPLIVDAYVHDMANERKQVLNVLGVHRDWVSDNGSARRAIVFDHKSGELVEVDLSPQVRLDSAHILALSRRDEQETHCRLSAMFQRLGIAQANPYQPVARIADDKMAAYRVWRKHGVPTPASILIPMGAVREHVEREVGQFAAKMATGRPAVTLVAQPNFGTEGQGVEAFEVDPASWPAAVGDLEGRCTSFQAQRRVQARESPDEHRSDAASDRTEARSGRSGCKDDGTTGRLRSSSERVVWSSGSGGHRGPAGPDLRQGGTVREAERPDVGSYRSGSEHSLVAHILDFSTTGSVIVRQARGNVRYAPSLDGPGRSIDFRLNVSFDGESYSAVSGYAQVAGDEGAFVSSVSRGGKVVRLPKALGALAVWSGGRLRRLVLSPHDSGKVTEAACRALEALNSEAGEAEGGDPLLLSGIDVKLEVVELAGGLVVNPVVLDANPRPAGLTHSLPIEEGRTGADRGGSTFNFWAALKSGFTTRAQGQR